MVKLPLKQNIWEIIIWLSLAVIFFWAVAKSLGWIKTPLFVELLPLFGGIFAAGGFFQYMRHMLKDLRREIREVKVDLKEFKEYVHSEFKETIAELHSHDRRLIRIETRLA